MTRLDWDQASINVFTSFNGSWANNKGGILFRRDLKKLLFKQGLPSRRVNQVQKGLLASPCLPYFAIPALRVLRVLRLLLCCFYAVLLMPHQLCNWQLTLLRSNGLQKGSERRSVSQGTFSYHAAQCPAMLRTALPNWVVHCQVQSASEQVVEMVEQVDQKLHEVGQ